jgi:heme-degrading monooxygenase HmoA
MRGKVKPGRRDEYERMFAEVSPAHMEHGLVSAELAWEVGDPDRFLEVIHFRDRESYERNADRPETDADYRRQLELLDGEPEWIDVEYGASTHAMVGA